MKFKGKYFLVLAAALQLPSAALLGWDAQRAHADTTTNVIRSETRMERTEKPVIAPEARVLDLEAFDLNNDMMLTRGEIGEKLFDIYDTDGNDLIDNIEYGRSSVLTVVPFEKETTYTYDYDGDGVVDEKTVTYESFMERTMLTRFDDDRDGLSPREFTGRHFNEADVDNDRFVDLEEWKASYDSAIDARLQARTVYND